MISLIIPSLNSQHIKEIVEIIKRERSRFGHTEIIVVGKDDQGLLADEKEITFIDTGKALSPARNRNIGLKLARGEIIVFLDSDCIPQNGCFSCLIEAHKSGKKVVGGAIDFKGGNFWQLSDNIIHFYGSHPSQRRETVKDRALPTAILSLAREAVEAVGFFSEDLITGEDFEYCLKLLEKGYILNFERKALVIHLTGRTNLGGILRHSRAWAKNSIHLRKRFGTYLKTPFFMKNGLALWLSSPLLAGLTTFKVFFTAPALRSYWYTAPVIYLAKLVWSLTAAQELFNAP